MTTHGVPTPGPSAEALSVEVVMTSPAISRVISPVQLLGASWTAADCLMFVPACVVVLAAFAVAIAWVVRGQAPLEAAQ